MSKLLPCKCGSMPEQELKRVMRGKVQDGGYDVIIGRYACPKCGAAPSWGKCYSIHRGWSDKHIDVWNNFISRNGGKHDDEAD